MRLRILVFVAAVALGAAACGSDDPPTQAEPAEAVDPVTGEPIDEMVGGDTSTVVEPEIMEEAPAVEATAEEPAAAPAGPGDVPNLQMIDMHTGATLDLQSVVDGQTPLLFWFWAPH